MYIYSVSVYLLNFSFYPWVILGESLGYPLVMSLFRPYFELYPTRKGSMTVHRTLNRAKPFTPQGREKRDEKKRDAWLRPSLGSAKYGGYI